MAIQVRPNGNPVTAVDAHMDLVDFTPRDLRVLRIVPTEILERELEREFNNVFGTARYSASTVGAPLISEFELATLEVSTSQIARRGDAMPPPTGSSLSESTPGSPGPSPMAFLSRGT